MKWKPLGPSAQIYVFFFFFKEQCSVIEHIECVKY